MSGTIVRAVQSTIFLFVFLATLFGGAGTLRWPRAWLYTGLSVVGMAALGVVVKRLNPGLIEARTKWRYPNTKPFDRVIPPIYVLLTLAQLSVAGMDAVRFGWSTMPYWCLYAGVALFAPPIALITWTMTVNPFAETTVRIQSERGHKVVDAGPYRYVRHPMYVAIVIMHVAAPLILGSMWALALAAPIAILFVVRTALEDRTLRRELAGYDDYARRTHYRLLPGVW
jgi:protein-S-isoprenylcysteine O-methyltransferase Ste14